MPQWEYQVIHLNVEGAATAPGSPGAAPASPPAAGSSQPKPPPVFSQDFLQKEFPGFYTPNDSSKQHPAQQLQTFLNGVGQQGWSLIGVFPLGPLLMMIFRRRQAAPSTSPEPVETPQQPEQPPTLEDLLRRIEAIEQHSNPPLNPEIGTP